MTDETQPNQGGLTKAIALIKAAQDQDGSAAMPLLGDLTAEGIAQVIMGLCSCFIALADRVPDEAAEVLEELRTAAQGLA